jgi:PAX-interacting protein 1
MEFHTYQLKEERSYRVMLKNMHYSTNPQEIINEIEKLGHTVTNIWNIKQYRTKLPLSRFFVKVKPAPNNKDIFNVEYTQQYKIKFKLPKHKRDIAQCANCQRYGHTKKYCHLKSRCVRCAVDHLTNKCHRKEKSSDVRCVLCGGTHPANYKGCTVYKDLQKKAYPPLRLKVYTPPAQIKQTLYTQPGITYAQKNPQKFLHSHKDRARATHNQSHQQTCDIKELKNMTF